MAQAFSLHDFIKNGLMDAAQSRALPTWTITERAVGYYEKGVLKEQDLADIQAVMDQDGGRND